MNNIYVLLKLNRYVTSPHLKSLGVFLLHILGKRYLGVFLDPVLACNLRCRMCYFSDPEKRKSLKGIFKQEDLQFVANAFFHRALKLQIGCGAEPSLFRYNEELIRRGKEKKVPYISMTTNANLFTKEDWTSVINAGLDEVTISLHGVSKETYEYMMPGASYEKILQSLQILSELKKAHPHFKIRLNYTVNRDNLQELGSLYDILSPYIFDILQIRPVNRLGETEYNHFSWKEIYDSYDDVLGKLKKESADRGIIFLAPDKKDFVETKKNNNKILEESTYCYISPNYIWRDDFNLETDTYETYAKRIKLGRILWKNVFKSKDHYQSEKSKLNYEIN
jgi:molybdenum cofactor biosynthesis enzyme MoaA